LVKYADIDAALTLRKQDDCRDHRRGSDVTIDVLRPLQAYDSGGRARAIATMIEAMARAKEAGLAPSDMAAALQLVDWND
jgi:hypothetical protein